MVLEYPNKQITRPAVWNPLYNSVSHANNVTLLDECQRELLFLVLRKCISLDCMFVVQTMEVPTLLLLYTFPFSPIPLSQNCMPKKTHFVLLKNKPTFLKKVVSILPVHSIKVSNLYSKHSTVINQRRETYCTKSGMTGFEVSALIHQNEVYWPETPNELVCSSSWSQQHQYEPQHQRYGA